MTDLIIVMLYLLFTIALGYWSGRNLKNLKDFAISHRQYDTYVLVATMTATLIGGGASMGMAAMTYTVGIVFIFAELGTCLNQILIAQFVAPRIARYDGMLSIGEMLGSHYGIGARVTGGIVTACLSVGFTAIQVGAIGLIFHYFLGIDQFLGILIGVGIVIFYSTMGGIRSVITTDFFQFAILIIEIPMLCTVGLHHIGGLGVLLKEVPASKLTLFPEQGDVVKYMPMFLTFLLVGSFYPSMIQRLLVAKDIKQAIQATRISGLVVAPFFITVGLVGLIAYVVNPGLDPSIALPFLVNELMPIGLKGFLIAGILAIVMSTADSELNVASVAVVHDIVKPFRKKALSHLAELRLARWVTIILGMTTIFIAVAAKSLFHLILYTYTFWGPTILVPFLVAIWGYKMPKHYFVSSVTTGIVTVLIWNIYMQASLGFDGFIPGVLSSVFVFGFYRLQSRRLLLRTNEA